MTRRHAIVMAACAIWLLLVAADISGCQGQTVQPKGNASPQPIPTLRALAVTPIVPSDEGPVAQLVSDQDPATFDHSPIRPLGLHQGMDCEACHGAGRSVTCESCHQTSANHLPGIRGDCFRCHSSESWRQAKYDHKSLSDLAAHQDGFVCGSCHEGRVLAAGTVKCQVCHDRPAQHVNTASAPCVQCHQVAGWTPAKFDHSGLAPLGKHQEAACASCHTGGQLTKATVSCQTCHTTPAGHAPGITDGCVRCHSPAGWKPAKVTHTNFALTGQHQGVACAKCHGNGVYAGRPSTCESCHSTPGGHIPGIASGCVQCHSPSGWKPANVNHSKFALAGQHQGVACAKCHGNGIYAGRPSTCESCHSTPGGHIPGITNGCVQCHSPTGWKPASFNHSKFALTGQHQNVACAKCHGNGIYAGRPSTCESCHSTPSGHIPGITSGCVQCHSPSGWKPATFNHSKFALTGQHQSVACAKCHGNGVYAGRPSTCESCHSTPGGHIPGITSGCVQCHSPTGWKPATFNHSKFALTGQHQNVACAKCHSNSVYAGRPSTCESCHSTPSGHIPGITSGCVQCHSPSGWKPATFNHSKFALTGKHTGVACAKCHGNGVYAGRPSTCESCHKTPTGHIPGITSGCVQCHSPTGWKPATFNHSKFALTGKHQTVACAKCHGNGVYAGRSPACESCHSTPSGHIPGITSGCVQCHSPTGWKPASFNHSKFALTGKHQTVACASCHKNGGYAGTSALCQSCHTPPSTHAGLNPACATCHTPTGFKPSTFVHRSVGEHIGSNPERPQACTTCHPSKFTDRNCLGSGCHKSTPRY